MEKQFVETELAKYDYTEAKIKELEDKYLGMKVSGVDDMDNYLVCKDAHQEMKKSLSNIETIRKDLKADSITFGNLVDAEAKKWSAPVRKIVDYLAQQRAVVEDEKKRIIEEKAQKDLEEHMRKRREEEERLEAQRKEQEEKERQQKEEQARIDEENRKIEEKKKEAQDKIDADNRKLEEEKAKFERDKQEEKDRIARDKKHAQEVEKAKIEATQREQKRKEEEEKEKIRLAEEAQKEAKEREESAPDRIKLKKVATDISLIEMPILNSLELDAVLSEVMSYLKKVCDLIAQETE